MHISPNLILTLGVCTAFLFLTVFIIALIITVRNRHTIQKYSSQADTEFETDLAQGVRDNRTGR